MSATLHEMLEEISGKMPGCLHTSVIDSATGLALAACSDSDPLDGAGADAFHSDLYRLSEAVIEGIPTAGEPRELVLTSKEATFVSVPVEETGYMWLVVAGRDTTVGFIQALMRKYVARIEEGLQALV